MDYSTLDDKALIKLIAQAHENALSELYDRYGRLVFSIALHTVGNRGTAEEIALDIFTRVWEKAGAYRPEKAKVTTWLTSMTRNRAIDMLRREGSRAESKSISWAEVTSEPVNHQIGPETAVSLSLQKQEVRAAVAQLSPELQEALALAYFKGQSHSQIAKTLNQPLGTVKSRIRKAMKTLRTLLLEEQSPTATLQEFM
jgi:RNA polymerase sigma-70 factor (ECF subfamily)